MRYLFRGLIRESGKTVEGAVEADTPEDALNALSSNGIVTEDLTPAPIPIDSVRPSSRASYTPRTAGRAGAPPLPPGVAAPASGEIAASEGGIEGGARPAPANGAVAPRSEVVAAEAMEHPGARSDDPIDRAFAAASQSVSFDAVAQRYRGKSVWVIDRDKIRRQVATVVDAAIKKAATDRDTDEDATGDRVRESVAEALKELFKDNRNIASQQTPEQAEAARQQQAQAAPAATSAVSSPQLEALAGRLEAFLGKAETVLTQLQVAARRVGSGGGGAAGFAPRRMSHIPKPRGEEQNAVLMEIFKSNVKLRENLAKRDDPTAATPTESDAESAAEPAGSPT